MHPNTRTATNVDLCLTHILGEYSPNYTVDWKGGLRFVAKHLTPQPPSFRAGVSEKVCKDLLAQFDDTFAGILQGPSQC